MKPPFRDAQHPEKRAAPDHDSEFKPPAGVFRRSLLWIDARTVAFEERIQRRLTRVGATLRSLFQRSGRKKRVSAREPTLQSLLYELQSDLPEVRRKAVTQLGRLDDPHAFLAVTQSLNDKAPQVRCAVVEALHPVPHPHVLLLLIQALRDSEEQVRYVAATALALRSDESAILALLEALHDPSSLVLINAIRALCRHREPRGLPRFLEALHDAEPSVRAGAARALGDMQEIQTIPYLIQALTDPVGEVRTQAGIALLQFGDRERLTSRVLTASDLSIPAKVDILEILIRTRFHYKQLHLDYRAPSVAEYCRERLQEETTPALQAAIRAVQEEIQNRSDRQGLLRIPQPALHPEELLHTIQASADISSPTEMLRASQKQEANATPRSS